MDAARVQSSASKVRNSMSPLATAVFALVALIVIASIAGASGSAAVFVAGIVAVIAFIAWSGLRRRIRNLEAALQDAEREHTLAIGAIASRLRELERRPAAAAARPAEAPVAPEPVAEPVFVPLPDPVPEPVPVAAFEAAPPPVEEAQAPRWTASVRSALDLEQMLGANWLSKIGVAILVLGVAFFLAWQLRELGPAGKVSVGVLVAAALLGCGIWGERRDRYRILARAALAGGWALLFFVSYAAHQIAAARVIDSPLLGFGAMLLVAAAMVAHTLRFRSQVVTGLAFGLAFTTVAINRVDVNSLVANVVLAIGFSFVVVRMRWFALEILGIAATYLNHAIWLVPIIAPMHGKVHPFPQFFASAAILLAYWAVYRASYVFRPPDDERTSAIAAVLNSACLLGVMKYQSARPELAFYALLALGAVELTLSLLPNVRRRRMAFLVLTTLGTLLVAAAFPFRFAPASVTPIWLIEAALLVAVGVIADERAYRLLGALAALATAVQLVSVPTARLLGARLGGGYPREHEWILGAIACAAMLVFYAAGEWLPRRRPAMFAAYADRRIACYLSYAAAFAAAIAGWTLFPLSGAAVFWIAIAVVVAVIGGRNLVVQANLLVAAATVRVLAVNLTSGDTAFDGVTWRVITVAIIAIAIYAISRWNGVDALKRMPAAARWIASGLLALLAWYELLPIAVGVAWAALGLLLLEAAVFLAARTRVPDLRVQAYVALAAAFARVFAVNMNAAGAPRIYTVAAIAVALLYAYVFAPDTNDLFAWLSAISVLALLRFELRADYVAIGWAAMTLVLVALSLTGRRVFLHIGIAAALATLSRGVLHNLYERSWFPPPNAASTWLLVGGAAALLFASLPLAFRVRRMEPVNEGRPLRRVLRWLDGRPEQLLLFAPLLLVTVLLGAEMRRGMLTVAWGIEAVVVIVFALWVGERAYRLCGLALLMLCVGKIFVFDFWSLTLRDKALTGIVVGVALIAVSVLYTRKREAILQFL
jgi:Predicted membrane protein (DUF2339)